MLYPIYEDKKILNAQILNNANVEREFWVSYYHPNLKNL